MGLKPTAPAGPLRAATPPAGKTQADGKPLKARGMLRRRKRRKEALPERGWGLIRDAAGRLGLWSQLSQLFVQRAFALAMRKLVPRLMSEARAEALSGDALVVRVSSSAVASELTYVRDLLLTQVNEELLRLRTLSEGGPRGASRLSSRPAGRAPKPGPAPAAAQGPERPPTRVVKRLVHRVGPVQELPDAAEWLRAPRPKKRLKPLRPPPTPDEEAELVAALGAIGDGGLRDALGALYLSARRGGG
jgi:hypothetical protein